MKQKEEIKRQERVDDKKRYHQQELPLLEQQKAATTNTQRPTATNWDDPARYFVDSLKPQKQKFSAPPNRFNISPGEHWDGIDRSNGYERTWFQKQATKEAANELSYKRDYEDL